MDIRFSYEDQKVALDVRALHLKERLGEPGAAELELFAREAIAPKDLKGKACVVAFGSDLGERAVHGVIFEATAIATVQRGEGRTYRIVMRSALTRLGLGQRRRIFQEKSAPDIVALLFEEGGLGTPKRELSRSYSPRRYVTQYDESDLTFIRRLCEEDGFYFRFEAGEEKDEIVLMDDVSAAPKGLDAPLPLAEEAGLGADKLRAWHGEVVRRRAPGRVVAADYEFRKPALDVKGEAKGGHASEERWEVFKSAARAADPAGAEKQARILLESLRAESLVTTFETSAFVLAPGKRVEVEAEEGHLGSAVPAHELFVVATEHRWAFGKPYDARVTAVPVSVPYRLEPRTLRPKASGIETALVTGAPGDEICADHDGCVRVRFHWDRSGPTDDKSSLPVRVLQPNVAGSMLIPRVGWEVWVGFDGGDPDRPFVLGRAYNAKQPPPVALPANKTMTSWATSSSPGGGGQNSVHFEDGAGRQGVSWNAQSAMVRSIAANETVQTVADEGHSVAGSQTISIGANDDESVTAVRGVQVGSQMLIVGANHEQKTPAAQHTKTGAETVLCAVLMEGVGSPGGALDALKSEAAAAVGGLVPGVGAALGIGMMAKGAYDAYQKGGLSSMFGELGKGALGFLPGGDLANDAIGVVEAGGHAPWQSGDEAAAAKGGQGGGAESSLVGGVAAAAGGGAGGGGGGFRVHQVSGATLELIGGAYTIATGGQSRLTTLGASTIGVGGPHATAAGKVSWLTGGVSTQTTGAYGISAVSILRKARALETTAAGAFASSAKGGYKIKAGGGFTLNCGALKVAGKLVLEAGGTTVTIDGSGLTVKGAKVEFDGDVTCASAHRD